MPCLTITSFLLLRQISPATLLSSTGMDWKEGVQLIEEIISSVYVCVFLSYLFLKLKAASHPLIHTEIRGLSYGGVEYYGFPCIAAAGISIYFFIVNQFAGTDIHIEPVPLSATVYVLRGEDVAWDTVTYLVLVFDLIMVLVVGVRYCRGKHRIDSLFEASANQVASRTRYEHRRDAEKNSSPPEIHESGGEIGLIRATNFQVPPIPFISHLSAPSDAFHFTCRGRPCLPRC